MVEKPKLTISEGCLGACAKTVVVGKALELGSAAIRRGESPAQDDPLLYVRIDDILGDARGLRAAQQVCLQVKILPGHEGDCLVAGRESEDQGEQHDDLSDHKRNNASAPIESHADECPKVPCEQFHTAPPRWLTLITWVPRRKSGARNPVQTPVSYKYLFLPSCIYAPIERDESGETIGTKPGCCPFDVDPA